MENKYSNIYVTNEGEWLSDMSNGLPADVESYNYKINSQAAPTISVGFGSERGRGKSTTNLSDAQVLIDSVMSRAGYTRTQGTANLFYDKDSSTCTITDTGDVLTLSCSTSEILSNIAADAKPFVDAYLAAKPDAADNLAIGPIVIKNSDHENHVITASKRSGYKIAEALIVTNGTKYLALFYQKDGGNWAFVSQAADEYGFNCGDFTVNPDARAAFYDQICLGPEGQVRLDTNNRALQ